MQLTGHLTAKKNTITRLLLIGGAAGPLFFILVFLLEGATRPGYSAWRHFVSQLSLSSAGWMQVLNFLVCGVLSLGFAIALRQVLHPGKSAFWGTLLLGTFSIGLIVAGLFSTDPALGYPVGAHMGGPQTLHGTIHGLAGLTVFSSLTAACFVMARYFVGKPQWKGWTLYSTITGVIIAVFFIAAMVASVLDGSGVLPDAPTGFFQRISIIAGWGWIALLAIQLLNKRAYAKP